MLCLLMTHILVYVRCMAIVQLVILFYCCTLRQSICLFFFLSLSLFLFFSRVRLLVFSSRAEGEVHTSMCWRSVQHIPTPVTLAAPHQSL